MVELQVFWHWLLLSPSLLASLLRGIHGGLSSKDSGFISSHLTLQIVQLIGIFEEW
jgi:hypothetical protein